jgi:predicted glycosyl hydrolase (DUF1957 family)
MTHRHKGETMNEVLAVFLILAGGAFYRTFHKPIDKKLGIKWQPVTAEEIRNSQAPWARGLGSN